MPPAMTGWGSANDAEEPPVAEPAATLGHLASPRCVNDLPPVGEPRGARPAADQVQPSAPAEETGGGPPEVLHGLFEEYFRDEPLVLEWWRARTRQQQPQEAAPARHGAREEPPQPGAAEGPADAPTRGCAQPGISPPPPTQPPPAAPPGTKRPPEKPTVVQLSSSPPKKIYPTKVPPVQRDPLRQGPSGPAQAGFVTPAGVPFFSLNKKAASVRQQVAADASGVAEGAPAHGRKAGPMRPPETTSAVPAAPATTTVAAPDGREGAAERRDEETADEDSLMQIRLLQATGRRDLAEKFGQGSSDADHVRWRDQEEQHEGLAEKMANDRSALRYT